MDKTPDYTFSLNDKIISICKEDDNLLLFGVYTTCLAKAALQFKKDFNSEAIKLFEDFDANKIEKYIK